MRRVPTISYRYAVDCQGTAGWVELFQFSTVAQAQAFMDAERADDNAEKTLTRWDYRIRDSRLTPAPDLVK